MIQARPFKRANLLGNDELVIHRSQTGYSADSVRFLGLVGTYFSLKLKILKAIKI